MKSIIRFIELLLVSLCIFTIPVLAEDLDQMTYKAYLTNTGWSNTGSNNEVVGKPNETSITAFEVLLPGESTGLEYSVYTSNSGWQGYVKNNNVAGKEKGTDRIEALKIRLTGSQAQSFDIYYRVYTQSLGWLNWTSNDQISGTIGLDLPVQAIQLSLVPKATGFTLDAPSDCEYSQIDASSFKNEDLVYTAHVEFDGWQENKYSGETAGTEGESKQVEAITINHPQLKALSADSNIVYSTHVENIGWTENSQNGETSGTIGQNLAVQALKLDLTGVAAKTKDIYYRVHVQNKGWLDWAKNGQPAGTEGMGLQVEAFEIRILPKSSDAPGSTETPYLNREELLSELNLSADAHIEREGWSGPYVSGDIIGSEEVVNGIEGLKFNIDNSDGSVITYNLCIDDTWQDSKQNGQISGTEGEGKQAEAVTMNLAGNAADEYDLYFQVYAEDYGWLGWTKNGEWAGTIGGNKKMQALRFELVLEGEAAPGSTENNFIEYKKMGNLKADQVDQFDLICAIVQHEGGANYDSALAVMSCVMNRVDSGRWGGSDPVSVLTAPGQFSSYLGGYYKQFLGRSALSVQQAVLDCLNGKRNHPYQSFRSYPTSGSVNIGGNWYF